MIPLFIGDDRNKLTYDSYVFNQEIDGSKRDIVEVNYVNTQTAYQSISERHEFTDGLEVYPAYKVQKRLILRGFVRASSRSKLYDRVEELAAAFDPALVSHDNPDEAGFLGLDFDVPTDDTDTYSTGLIACRYYVRAEAAVEPGSNQYSGLAVEYMLSLIAADPRRYTQSTESLTGAGTADNSKASYWSWPTLTIAASGAGSSTFTIANTTQGGTALVLDLSDASDGDSISVDMRSRTIKNGTVEKPDYYVSGDYFWMEPGSNTITVSNDTNMSPTLTWRPAFSA